MRVYRILLVLLPFFFFQLEAFSKRLKPLIWDMARLEQIKKNQNADEEAQMIIRYADEYCRKEPCTITEDKRLHFCEDTHFYTSMGPYRWKDPENPGRYILRDGVANPERKYYEAGRLSDMSLRCVRLSKAFYFTKDKKYYKAFLNQIRAWFIDTATYMYPNFEYAQVIPGENNNKGTSMGMIEAYAFNEIIESTRLVDSIKRIDRKTMKALKAWIKEFTEWSIGKYGEYFQKVQNNISLAYDVTMINMYLFIENEEDAKMLADCFTEKRINTQINEDGSQPAELIRTKAFFYSLYNLEHILDFCFLALKWDRGFYQKNGERIDKAFDYLQQYADAPSSFPYQQISGWEECISMFDNLKYRRNNLRNTVKK